MEKIKKPQRTFMEYFWTWNYVNYLSELFARERIKPFYSFLNYFEHVGNRTYENWKITKDSEYIKTPK